MPWSMGVMGATAQLDIPASGLQLYLDANNPISYSGSGTQWLDISGNNRHFNWSSVSYNSTGIKSFNTNGRRATGPASNSFGINNTSGYSVVYTFYQNSLQTASSFKWYSSNGSGSAGRGIFAHSTWTDSNLYWDQGGCCNADTRTIGSIPSSTGTWHFIVLRNNHAATSRTIWRNNSIIATNTSGIANINLSGTGADIGGADEGTNWDARIAQFALYNRPVTDAEIEQLWSSFRVKVAL